MTSTIENSNWTSREIGDQSNRIVIVTGSTSGIGKEAARVLARKNAHVILAVRNTNKGHEVASEMRAENPDASLEVRELDLSSLDSVRDFADGFTRDHDRLDVLINNAGVMMPPYSKTADGFEIQMGTNHLGHFALTGLLLPALKATEGSRVVNVSSMAHSFGDIDFDDLDWESRKYNTRRAYADSKIANLYFTYELAERLQENGSQPMVTAAHPGWTATELQRHSGIASFLNRFFAQDVDMGALPTLMAGFDDDSQAGQFFGPAGRSHWRGYPVAHESNDLSHDRAKAKQLWDVSEELTGVSY